VRIADAGDYYLPIFSPLVDITKINEKIRWCLMAFARLTRNLAPEIAALSPTIICYILNYSGYRVVSV
jgi:hypothetical protein